MQQLRYYILALMSVIMLGACSESSELPGRDVHFCVRADWNEGRSLTRTKAMSDAILTSGTAGIPIPTEEYPATITIKDNNNSEYTLNKVGNGTTCPTHGGYIVYNPETRIDGVETKSFTVSATLDGEPLSGSGQLGNDGHVQFTLEHTKALLRLGFKVVAKYDQIRNIKINEIQLNGTTCTMVDKVLNTNMQLIAYGYIDPSNVTITSNNTLTCKYDVYDKDGVTSDHLVKSATATNTFTLGSASITSILVGYYYDLNVTLNPDYLGVLSDHDNKGELTIN